MPLLALKAQLEHAAPYLVRCMSTILLRREFRCHRSSRSSTPLATRSLCFKVGLLNCLQAKDSSSFSFVFQSITSEVPMVDQSVRKIGTASRRMSQLEGHLHHSFGKAIEFAARRRFPLFCSEMSKKHEVPCDILRRCASFTLYHRKLCFSY